MYMPLTMYYLVLLAFELCINAIISYKHFELCIFYSLLHFWSSSLVIVTSVSSFIFITTLYHWVMISHLICLIYSIKFYDAMNFLIHVFICINKSSFNILKANDWICGSWTCQFHTQVRPICFLKKFSQLWCIQQCMKVSVYSYFLWYLVI